MQNFSFAPKSCLVLLCSHRPPPLLAPKIIDMLSIAKVSPFLEFHINAVNINVCGFLNLSSLFRMFFGVHACSGILVKVKLLSHVRLFVTPWTVAGQAPQSMGFSLVVWSFLLLYSSPWICHSLFIHFSVSEHLDCSILWLL